MKPKLSIMIIGVFIVSGLLTMMSCFEDPGKSPLLDQSALYEDPVNAPGTVAQREAGKSRIQYSSANGMITSIPYESLSCAGVITFEDVAGGPSPGTNYDNIFESDGADFAERFAGQTLATSGDFDVLSGTPTGPLSLQVGVPNQNLQVYDRVTSQTLTGLGPLGFPNADAIGEGSFAVLFDFDQSEFGFRLVGGNAGSATIQFFKRDGTLIDVVVVTNLADDWYGFSRVGDINDIAGVSVHNDDPAGIGVDDICHDVPGVVGDPFFLDIKPGSCPNALNPWFGGRGNDKPYKGKAVLPVAILGTESFDVTDIDVSTIMLEGLQPIRYSYDDVATPLVDAENCDCISAGGDGYADLTLKFSRKEIVDGLGAVSPGDEIVLTITGMLLDGRPFEASDCVRIVGNQPTPEAGTE